MRNYRLCGRRFRTTFNGELVAAAEGCGCAGCANDNFDFSPVGFQRLTALDAD